MDVILIKINWMHYCKGIIFCKGGVGVLMLVVSHSVCQLPHSFLACLLVILVVLKHRICNERSSVARTQHYPVKRHRKIIHLDDRMTSAQLKNKGIAVEIETQCSRKRKIIIIIIIIYRVLTSQNKSRKMMARKNTAEH